MRAFLYIIILCLIATYLLLLTHCNHPTKETTTTTYLNLNDTVKYVGMNTCKQCHYNVYETFIHTGMGQSFDTADQQKSKAVMDANTILHDPYSNFSYKPFWKNDYLFIEEYRLNNADTIHKRTEKVDYVIGSGQHTNSHLCNRNGYLYQMPMTFYTQKEKWDLPPGFEKGFNSRFERKIGLECMSCHNAYPDFVKGSENKYYKIPDGIDCERCHGPGALHVKQKTEGIIIDTSKYIDYSIVNPAKLSIDLQFDVCQRCHLQGNTVLQEGKSFYDFKPGMKLSEIMNVFLPIYTGAEDEFIMASHADRLKMSACFIKSFVPAEKESLRPYKQSLTCVSCHNPHVSVNVTDKEIFNSTCKNCHSSSKQNECNEELSVRKKEFDNCVHCHMPKSNTIDIPHVVSTDHYIHIPISKDEKEKIRQFVGLVCINNTNTNRKTKVKAYLNQFEKFESKAYLLDSAKLLLNLSSVEETKTNFDLLIHLYFLQNDYKMIVRLAQQIGKDDLLKKILINTSWSNEDAWTCYRIGEAYNTVSNYPTALLYFQQATKLAPFNLDFLTKHANTLMNLQRTTEAISIYQSILKEDNKYVPAITNLGFAYLTIGKIDQTEQCYSNALNLNPDYEPLLLNIVGLYIYKKQFSQAKKLLAEILKKNPSNTQAKNILQQLSSI